MKPNKGNFNFEEYRSLFHLELEKVKKLSTISKEKKSKNKKKILFILLIISLLISGLWLNSKIKSDFLIENGKVTDAVIEHIMHNHHRMNDMGGEYVDNYHIKYQFVVGDDKISNTAEILTQHFDLFFDKNLQINDTIRIRYNPNNPKENEIIKIK